VAFRRYANAVVTHPLASQAGWERVRRAGGPRVASASTDLVAQATGILNGRLDPDRYLLSHATIVCSVDTDPTPNVRLGRVDEGGQTVNRRWGNYLITPNCSKYVNNNGDAWTRPVLMKAYRTFVGAHNFLEHVQVEDLSKGRIIDAVPRDVGESLYIDILVATDRKHTDLIADIESGKLAAMSMGCNVEHTTCTKCGNVAVDETEMCEHVRYQKLNKYFDNAGKQRIVAELCGHESEDPTGGVTFIEASWVANPAFTGAVMRNILSPANVTPDMVRQANRVLAAPPRKWVNSPNARAANVRYAEDPVFDFGAFDDGGADGGSDKPAEPKPSESAPSEAAPAKTPAPKTPAPKNTDLDDPVDRLYRQVLERVEKRVEDTLRGKPSPIPEKSTAAPNENLNKEASVARTAAHRIYAAAVQDILATSASDVDVVERVASLDRSVGLRIPVAIYRTALRVGSTHRYTSEASYISACADALGRVPDQSEADSLVRVGRILNHAEVRLRTDKHARSQR
jgi:hypothetical protein